MRSYLTALLSILSITLFAQDKNNYVYFNKLTEIKGTEFVIASIEHWGKIDTKSKYLLFINTTNGESRQIDFHKDDYIEKVEQIKIDTLNINKVLVKVATHILVISSDGQERTQITDDKYFARTWAVNNQTGTITMTGHYDSNNNGKYDKTDKNEIIIYDLKTMKVRMKI
jgi:hypothetical protein